MAHDYRDNLLLLQEDNERQTETSRGDMRYHSHENESRKCC